MLRDKNRYGPHGGPLVATDDGVVEMSVFETGVPPRFRLYFFDSVERPLALPGGVAVTIEIIRPGGTRQTFHLVVRDGFLESDSNIPEPHEFDVTLTISHDGPAHTYCSKFTEKNHGHGYTGHEHSHHGHSRPHGAGEHHHHHDRGVLGWLRGAFAHSHSAADKIDASMESDARGIWALKVGLLGLGITALFQVVIVVLSGSVGLLADTIHNFGDAGTSIPLWIAFSLTRRGASKRFTYGYGKTEDVAGIIIIAIIFFSACVAAFESVRKIMHPQSVTHLWWAAAAALIGFVGNEAVAVFRMKIGREIGSAALVADGQHARIDGLTSLAVLIGLLGVRLGMPILDPIIGILITVAILFIVKEATLSIWSRLIDGIEPEILADIEHAPTHVTGVQGVHGVRARWIGHKVYSDLTIDVDPSLPVQEADAIARQVEQSIYEHIRLLGGVTVQLRPSASLTNSSAKTTRTL